MSNELPVIAAIPNYNMGHHLRKLLPQVLVQGYDRIYVFDDGSTDDSVEVVKEFGGQVQMIVAPQNQGCTANRNQVLKVIDGDELIHFIDADMDLETENIADVARQVAARYVDKGVGAIGGLVSRTDGSQEPYNFGPAFCLHTHMTAIPPVLDRIRNRPKLARTIQQAVRPIVKNYPNVLDAPTAQETFWLHEGNMLIYADAYKSIGGYDINMRNHGAQDLAIRLEKKGIKRWFDPSIEVVHHYIDVRGKKRKKQQYESLRYLLGKHGFKAWVTGNYR
ncbi:glycosyltransferase family 2 protein [Mycobacterium sp. SMC-18]|uniref:glycosyltransferase family 2 protein n=1 Tax=unclassified Mycobacterium TaxID=2642494 RepID=UPI003204D462